MLISANCIDSLVYSSLSGIRLRCERYIAYPCNSMTNTLASLISMHGSSLAVRHPLLNGTIIVLALEISVGLFGIHQHQDYYLASAWGVIAYLIFAGIKVIDIDKHKAVIAAALKPARQIYTMFNWLSAQK